MLISVIFLRPVVRYCIAKTFFETTNKTFVYGNQKAAHTGPTDESALLLNFETDTKNDQIQRRFYYTLAIFRAVSYWEIGDLMCVAMRVLKILEVILAQSTNLIFRCEMSDS
jgi:hypothetical protein